MRGGHVGGGAPLRPWGGMEKEKRRFAYLVVAPVLLYMLVWTLVPYVWVVVLSLFDYSPRRAGAFFLGFGGSNPFVGLANFAEMLRFGPSVSKRVSEFHIAFTNTLVFSLLVVPLNLALTLPLAVLVDRVRRKTMGSFLRTVFFLPVLTSSVGVGVMWNYIFNPQRGILNHFLSLLFGHRIFISWLGDSSIFFLGLPVPFWSVLVAYLWMDMGYNFVIFLTALQGIPQSLREAADLDGATPMRRFFTITVPLLMPQIQLTAILTMISAFQVFDIIQVMTLGGPNKLTRVLVLDIYENAFRFESMGWASAVSIVFFAVVLAISLAQRRLLRTTWEY
jgi:multiple sugar transport system permease protein